MPMTKRLKKKHLKYEVFDPLQERYTRAGLVGQEQDKDCFIQNARVWIEDPNSVWTRAKVLKDFQSDELLVEREDNGEEIRIPVKSSAELPPLCNPDILIGENDLTALSYLHEPAVLHNIKVRFEDQNNIYTYCGIVLVAVNPYQELPIYGNGTIMAYRAQRGQDMSAVEPHIFAVAEEAYTQMERFNKDQSIIVSGESGAGKTVSAKYAMRYFATVSGSADDSEVEQKVLASNPIMEAIGNAKTTRNDNSSRFGKYIGIDFNKNQCIIGANMRTYLLEKSRVVFQAPGERNYHIFYQMCAGRDILAAEGLKFGLEHQNNFEYLKQGESPDIVGIVDANELEVTRNALRTLGFNEQTMAKVFQVLAAILHLGNVRIMEGAGKAHQDSCDIDPADPHLKLACELFGVELEAMRKWLRHRQIVSMKEVFTKMMGAKEAVFARDALAKHVYALLFSWIVSQINRTLAPSSKKTVRFIGVLDIYGFETFDVNSFEQFCINYANEKLQQQFCLHVFKLEQDEYLKENISWTHIDFYDNQPCIDLIEGKLGILDLLDEECKMPKGSDKSWVEKLYDKCKSSQHFAKPRLSNTSYIVSHFADKVTYECYGFLEKNRDTVLEEQMNLLKESRVDFVSKLFLDEPEKPKPLPRGGGSGLGPSTPKAPGRTSQALTPGRTSQAMAPGKNKSQQQMRKSVGSQFRDSLALLMETLNATTPHYVRCIKPNDDKEAFSFEPRRAVQQLRACGVLETIRISAAGFPSRWSYEDFFDRYRVLIQTQDINRKDLKSTCEKILTDVIRDEDKYKFGKTKIFFRAGQLAYLEKLRSEKRLACCVLIQKNIRMFIQRKKYLEIRRSVLVIQSRIRGMQARKLAQHLRETRAAIILQKHVRRFLAQRAFLRTKATVLGLQRFTRGLLARKNYLMLKYNAKATIIQAHVRGWLARRAKAAYLRKIVLAQCCIRRFLARRQLKKLKVEARSVEHQRKLNKGLENKIMQLQGRIDDLTKDNNALKNLEKDYAKLQQDVASLKTLQNQVKELSKRFQESQDENNKLIQKLEKERSEKMDLLQEKTQLELERKEMLNENMKRVQQQETILGEKGALEVKCKALEEKVQDLEMRALQAANAARTDSDYLSRTQELIIRNADLEQQVKNLKLQVASLGNGHARMPSDVSGFSEQGDVDSDMGYGSTRTRDSTVERVSVADIKWGKESDVLVNGDGGRRLLGPPLEDGEHSLEHGHMQNIKIQELEMENDRLKQRLHGLQTAFNSGDDNSNAIRDELVAQNDALQEELERRREECIQLRSVLADRARSSSPTPAEEGETDAMTAADFAAAMDAQKTTNRHLHDKLELQSQEVAKLNQELQRAKAEAERNDKISQIVNAMPAGSTERILQAEVKRLGSETLELKENAESLKAENENLKQQLKRYSVKLKETAGVDTVEAEFGEFLETNPELMPSIRHKESRTKEYDGMFEFDIENLEVVIRCLITGLKPRVAVSLLPNLPAFVVFMCLRHMDLVGADEKVIKFLSKCIQGVKKVIIKKGQTNMEFSILWLSNVCRLINNLKQYSGEERFAYANTPKMNEQCLRHFDLKDYRQILGDIGIWIYQNVVKTIQDRIQPYIVPAILENEPVHNVGGGGMHLRSRAMSVSGEAPLEPAVALEKLIADFDLIHEILRAYGADLEVTHQIFRQMMYFICAGALNNLLLRKNLCHWTRGLQVRYNISILEKWAHEHKMSESGVTDPLQPIIQAASLLQMRKTEDQVDAVAEVTKDLTSSQVVKILNLYTAVDAEDKVAVSFIRKVQEKLKERTETEEQRETLVLDTKFTYPWRLSFSPSPIRLEQIEVPDILKLNGILKKL